MAKQIDRFEEYSRLAHKTAIYPNDKALEYLMLGLCAEAGELANKIKKTIRDNQEIAFEDAVGELGDVLWYLSELSKLIAPRMDNPLGYVAYRNIEKLKDRQKRNKIKGSGDRR